MTNLKLNYKSDFKVVEKSDAGYAVPFRFTFFTGSPRQSFEAVFDGKTYENCHLQSDGSLCVAFDDHCLPCGLLKVERRYYLTDKCYASGICDEVIDPQPVVCTRVLHESKSEPIVSRGVLISQPASGTGMPMPSLQMDITALVAFKKGDIIELGHASMCLADTTKTMVKGSQGSKYEVKEDASYYLCADSSYIPRITTCSYTVYKREDFTITLAVEGEKTINAYTVVPAYYQEGPRSRYEESDHAQATADHTQATTDHSTATADHTQAESDHTRAESDHTTVTTDHAQVLADHQQASTDHETAASDHTQAESDHTRAESDHDTATSDHTRAMSDHSNAYTELELAHAASKQAAADHSVATADHTQAVSDHTQAESDHTQASTDHTDYETNTSKIVEAIEGAMWYEEVEEIEYDGSADGEPVAHLETKLAQEKQRALGVERTIAQNVTAEISRAEDAESNLQTQIYNEVNRARTAEQAETTRAKSAEAAEESRAKTAETDIAKRVSELEEANLVYYQTISEINE